MTRFLRFFFYLSFLYFAAFINDAQASERILLFKSDIKIMPDNRLEVTETIKVKVEGKKIERGIRRDFPTTYKDTNGSTVIVGFDIIDVQKDGYPEQYYIKSIKNGKRIYLGDKDIFLNHGIYTYTIKYITTRQIGFFQDFDELYWNVTGNAWIFPIDYVQTTITLPMGGYVIQYDAYTGYKGEIGKDFKAYSQDKTITFTTTRPLHSKEGFTVSVAFPKGIVIPPTSYEILKNNINDNKSISIPLIGLIVLFVFYMICWFLYGKDPYIGIIMPMFKPPSGISPAACRYILQMGDLDTKTHATAMISMAVKRYWRIVQVNDILDSKSYKLNRLKDNKDDLSLDEFALSNLLRPTENIFKIEQTNWMRLKDAIEEFEDSLRNKFNDIYFKQHNFTTLIGPLIIIGSLLASFYHYFQTLHGGVFDIFCNSIGLVFFGMISFVLTRRYVRQSVSAISIHDTLSKFFVIRYVIKTLIHLALSYCFFRVLGIVVHYISALREEGFQIEEATILKIIIFMGLFGVQGIFGFLMRAPTIEGQKIRNQILGFKMYLGLTEKDILNYSTPPDKTPQLFEQYLPYALALDVENEWAEQFADVFENINLYNYGHDELSRHTGFHPYWYECNDWSNFNVSSFTNDISHDLGFITSSCSTPPGSSSGIGGGGGGSGSGGGGFVGGGGGGGGGGGW